MEGGRGGGGGRDDYGYSHLISRVLHSLDELVKGFDYLQISAPNYQTTLSQIRSKFRQVNTHVHTHTHTHTHIHTHLI